MNTETLQYRGLTVHYRPHTLDQFVFNQIHREDEYRLKAARFRRDDVILDIGGHAGYFALAVLLRGAGHVHVYEISEENLELCERNLEPFAGRFTIHREAVWNEAGLELRFGRFPYWGDALNTGGASLLDPGEEYSARTVKFDDVVRTLTGTGPQRLRLLKLDAEGAEWPILLMSHTLAHIEQIVGEYHEIGGRYDDLDPATVKLPGFSRYTRQELMRCLRHAGFRVRLFQYPCRWGLFFARRRLLLRLFSRNRSD